jgi:alpha-N-arabinofuranosidase
MQLNGTASVGQTAKLISLTGLGLASTNTLTDPTRIVPVTSSVHAGSSFSHTMPGYSIQVLELSEK